MLKDAFNMLNSYRLASLATGGLVDLAERALTNDLHELVSRFELDPDLGLGVLVSLLGIHFTKYNYNLISLNIL